jgi:hypothetical protein
MNNLRRTIEELASDFASSIIGALRAASIDEISNVAGLAARRGRGGRGHVDGVALGATRDRGKRLGRRSVADIGRMVESIVGLLEKNPDGMRAEQIREALGCQAKELPRPLSDGLAAGRLKKTGQKRATTYFAGAGGGATGGGPKRRGRRGKRSA